MSGSHNDCHCEFDMERMWNEVCGIKGSEREEGGWIDVRTKSA